MTGRRKCADLCRCAECARLDLEYPNEGRQLAFVLGKTRIPRAVRARKATA